MERVARRLLRRGPGSAKQSNAANKPTNIGDKFRTALACTGVAGMERRG